MKKSDSISISIASEKELIGLAQAIGSRLSGGEVIELAGDIGSGKTTFVRGLAQGAGIDESVTSPTFVLQHKYEGPVSICHYDFYRLNDGGILSHEFDETLADGKSVVIVEWAETVKNVLPKKRIKISFTPTGDESRKLDIEVPESLRYISDAYTDNKN